MKKVICVLFQLFIIGTAIFAMGAPSNAYSDSNPLLSFLPLVVILFIFFSIFLSGKSRRGSPILVLKEFKLAEDENEFLCIRGRASGLLSWVLSLCGINPVSSLSCNKQSMKFEEAAIRYGKKSLDIPLTAVTCVSTGIYKPFGLLVIGIIFTISGIAGTFVPNAGAGSLIIGLIIAAIFFILYALKKQMFFGVYIGGDHPVAVIIAKKSIIEGQNINEQKFEAAANALNNAVLRVNYLVRNEK